jgi:peptidyl-prolyl cis-trans isomerase A (cyclophilin A)/peptidyl-prolyl cis-trans isomerase B (cyclophilin B)
MPKMPDFVNYDAETPALKQAFGRMRDQVKKLRESEIRFQNSDSKADEEKYKQQYLENREAGFSIHQQLIQAAVDEYLTNPSGKDKLGQILYNILNKHAKRDQYEAVLPIAKALFDNDFPQEDVAEFYAKCCLAENQYQQAAEPLKKMLERNPSNSQMGQLLKRLPEYESSWQAELAARKQDAEGPALPQAKVYTTKGWFVVELFENQAPEAVANFISLAESGFYDFLDFYLVIDQFGAQTGSPNEDPNGGPGYVIRGENGRPDARSIFRGTLCMAMLPGIADSAGSQFFITYLPILEGSKNYTAFGRVISGMHNLACLARVNPVEDKKDKKDETEKKQPDEIIRIEILKKRSHPYQPEKLPMPNQFSQPATSPSQGQP